MGTSRANVITTGADRRPSLPPGMCHAACYDEHGHTDGCLYDDGQD